MPLESATKVWNDKVKATLKYPSERESTAAQVKSVMAVVDAVEVSGIGYNHALRSGMYSWNQIMVTLKNEGQGWRFALAQTEPAYAFLMHCVVNDLAFDVHLEELEDTQNPGRGQWKNPHRTLYMCKCDPHDERQDGDLPFANFSGLFKEYGYVTETGSEIIGTGAFKGSPGNPPGTE